jgi:hypothetical protein
MTWDTISARMTQDSTITQDNINATTTYIVWLEERLWNFGVVLHRVRIFNLSSIKKIEIVSDRSIL